LITKIAKNHMVILFGAIKMILVALGTRPELLKIEPLLEYWKSIGFNEYRVWLTGQHEELCFELYKNWEFKEKVILTTCSSKDSQDNRLDTIVFSITKDANSYIFAHKGASWDKINAVLVQGDTASAFACALAAFHRQIPIIHLEAGLRSYDNKNPYPEEFYRRSISCMANINLCPTQENQEHLEEESLSLGNSYVVGNTILDTLKDKISSDGSTVLCTLHRRESFDQIEEWFKELDLLAYYNPQLKFILPIHKNPAIYKFKDTFEWLNCIDPLEHDELIDILKDCKAVITDSGGIAEEATWFKKPIFLCRKTTERPEGKRFYIWTEKPEDLRKFSKELEEFKKRIGSVKCPFGDGNASKNITNVLITRGIITLCFRSLIK